MGVGVLARHEGERCRRLVQQVKGESQCLDVILNAYREKCLDIVKPLDTFHISHIPGRRMNEQTF
jgi:hypothetical protein